MNKEDILKIEKIETMGQARQIFHFLGVNNKPEYNITKLCEELAELQDVLLKRHNKKPDKWPSDQSIIDEIGDVRSRITMFMASYGISEDDILKRHIDKSNKYLGYIKQNQYDRGI